MIMYEQWKNDMQVVVLADECVNAVLLSLNLFPLSIHCHHNGKYKAENEENPHINEEQEWA